MSQSFIKKQDNGPHSALSGLGVLSTERAPTYELFGYVVYESKFGGHWDFYPKDELPAGDFLKHRDHTPVYFRV